MGSMEVVWEDASQHFSSRHHLVRFLASFFSEEAGACPRPGLAVCSDRFLRLSLRDSPALSTLAMASDRFPRISFAKLVATVSNGVLSPGLFCRDFQEDSILQCRYQTTLEVVNLFSF